MCRLCLYKGILIMIRYTGSTPCLYTYDVTSHTLQFWAGKVNHTVNCHLHLLPSCSTERDILGTAKNRSVRLSHHRDNETWLTLKSWLKTPRVDAAWIREGTRCSQIVCHVLIAPLSERLIAIDVSIRYHIKIFWMIYTFLLCIQYIHSKLKVFFHAV